MFIKIKKHKEIIDNLQQIITLQEAEIKKLTERNTQYLHEMAQLRYGSKEAKPKIKLAKEAD